MTFENYTKCAYSEVLVGLHKNEISREDLHLWELLLINQKAIREFYNKLFLDVHIDEIEGYAFLKSLNTSQVSEEESNFPRLLKRMELSKPATLLLFLLRDALLNFDNSHQESLALVLTKKEIRELMLPYFDFQPDDIKFIQLSSNALDSVLSLGFLKSLKETESHQDLQKFEVRRIIKARITAEQLKAISELFPTHSANEAISKESEMELK